MSSQHHTLPVWGPKPWYSFDIYLVGLCLPSPNQEECVTPDMCVPIFPNTSHPEGRIPVRTEPPFPFDNCFIWSLPNLEIRVCPRAEGFDWDETTRLPTGPVDERSRWLDYEGEDRVRQHTARQARQQPDVVPNPHTSKEVSQSHPTPPVDRSHRAETAISPRAEDETSSISAGKSAYSCSMIASTDSIDSMTELERLFADPEESPELHPLCHLWCDLSTTIKQDGIPSPLLFFEERDAIIR